MSGSYCDECIALGCDRFYAEMCDCPCHDPYAETARTLGLRLVREDTDSGGDPRPRLYPS
jgi:hypothetical protein